MEVASDGGSNLHNPSVGINNGLLFGSSFPRGSQTKTRNNNQYRWDHQNILYRTGNFILMLPLVYFLRFIGQIAIVRNAFFRSFGQAAGSFQL